MSLIKISANRSVVVVQRGVLGNIGTLARFTIGQLAPYTVGQLVAA